MLLRRISKIAFLFFFISTSAVAAKPSAKPNCGFKLDDARLIALEPGATKLTIGILIQKISSGEIQLRIGPYFSNHMGLIKHLNLSHFKLLWGGEIAWDNPSQKRSLGRLRKFNATSGLLNDLKIPNDGKTLIDFLSQSELPFSVAPLEDIYIPFSEAEQHLLTSINGKNFHNVRHALMGTLANTLEQLKLFDLDTYTKKNISFAILFDSPGMRWEEEEILGLEKISAALRTSKAGHLLSEAQLSTLKALMTSPYVHSFLAGEEISKEEFKELIALLDQFIEIMAHQNSLPPLIVSK